jgi:OOP family OmpA-OmpF porin
VHKTKSNVRQEYYFMKKILMAVAITGAIVSAPASAQWYAGAGVGAAEAKLGTFSPAAGVSVNGSSSHETSWKLIGGYQLTPIWGMEAQYSDLGRSNYSLSDASGSGNGTYKAYQWSFAGTGTIPFGGDFYGFGKLGITSNHLTMSGACTPANCYTAGSGNKSDLLAGLGVGYNINKNIGVRFEYENFGKLATIQNGSSIKGDNWALSLKYSF